jgi:hypothetical protein
MPKKGQVSIGRHRRNCSICAHPHRDQIEADFISWVSPNSITREYGLIDRSSVYRHAHALSLFDKRRRNVRAALEKIIERGGDVEVTASAVVSAVQVYAKINSAGELINSSEQISMRDLYERMSREELEAYARTGLLPDWFKVVTKKA